MIPCSIGPRQFTSYPLAVQTLSKIADWSSITGVVIGIAGLVYSIRAFRAAEKAKQSADRGEMGRPNAGCSRKISPPEFKSIGTVQPHRKREPSGCRFLG